MDSDDLQLWSLKEAVERRRKKGSNFFGGHQLRSLKDSLENAPTDRVVKNKNKIKVNIKPSTRKNNINTEGQRRQVWKGLETVFYFLCYQCNCLLWIMQSLFLLNYYREFLAKLNASVLVYVSRCFNVFVW